MTSKSRPFSNRVTPICNSVLHVIYSRVSGQCSHAILVIYWFDCYFQIYYRQKGNRAVTRPQALQETFELCADVIIQKLQSYFQQADEYHNQCLQGETTKC